MANYFVARATRPKRLSEHVAKVGERHEARMRYDAAIRSLEDDYALRGHVVLELEAKTP